MGKRSNFERRERDFYPTPEAAIKPLLDFLSPSTLFVEPCVGEGHLMKVLQDAGHTCVYASDIHDNGIDDVADAKIHQYTAHLPFFHCFITNPPWDRAILHPMIENLARQAPTWLLFDADWMHTKQAAPYLRWAVEIVSVGRVKWIPGSAHTGKDNCCWYLFHSTNTEPTRFFGRTL